MDKIYHRRIVRFISLLIRVVLRWFKHPLDMEMLLTCGLSDALRGNFEIWATVRTTDGFSVDLVLVSGRDLGLDKVSSRSLVYRAAYAHGLTICPEIVADNIVVPSEYKSIIIGTEPIPQVSGIPTLLALDTRVVVDCTIDIPDDPAYVWSPDQLWVFAIP